MKVQFDSLAPVSAKGLVGKHAATHTDTRHKQSSLKARISFFLCAADRGSALVEFALILPMMLLLTTGILIFGVAMNNYLQLTHAVNVAARTVSLYGHDTGTTSTLADPCATASAAVMNES